MSGDLLEILFVAAFILFGLLGGRKKRPQQRTPPARPRPQTRAPGGQPTARRVPVPRPQPTITHQRAPDQDRLLRELEGLLTGRPVSEPTPASVSSPMRDMPDPDEAQSLESLEIEEGAGAWEEGLERTSDTAGTARWSAGTARAAESLETLEEAGGASHKRFHALYDRQPAFVQKKPAPRAIAIADVRRAIVWSEILGPPVSER